MIKREKVKNIVNTILRLEYCDYVTRDYRNTPMKNYRDKQRVDLLEKWAEE